MLSGGLILGLLPVACSKKGGDAAPRRDAGPRPKDRIAPAMSMPAPMTGSSPSMVVKKPRPRTGPSGIRECDQLLDVVCRCSERHPSLRIACKSVRASAAGYREKAQRDDPAQVQEQRQACVRALAEIKSSYRCK